MKWLKRIALGIIWSIVFFALSTFVLNLASGMVIYVLFHKLGLNVREHHLLINNISTFGCIILPFFIGLLGLILSIFGKMPGTKIKSKTEIIPSDEKSTSPYLIFTY